MVRIRLRRTGAKNNPTYRIVVADVRAPRDGDFIESIGHYLPTRQPHVVEINEERARHWISKGAQPSDTAATLLRQKGILNALGKLSVPGEEVAPRVYPAKAAPVATEPAVEATPAAQQEPVAAEATETPAVQAEAPVAQAEAPAVQAEAPVMQEQPVAQAEPVAAAPVEAEPTASEAPATQGESVADGATGAASTEAEPTVEAAV